MHGRHERKHGRHHFIWRSAGVVGGGGNVLPRQGRRDCSARPRRGLAARNPSEHWPETMPIHMRRFVDAVVVNVDALISFNQNGLDHSHVHACVGIGVNGVTDLACGEEVHYVFNKPLCGGRVPPRLFGECAQVAANSFHDGFGLPCQTTTHKPKSSVGSAARPRSVAFVLASASNNEIAKTMLELTHCGGRSTIAGM